MTSNDTKSYLVLEDRKEHILQGKSWKATDDYSLFHVTSDRAIHDRSILNDCTFLNLLISHRTDWGAPIPSTFQAFVRPLLSLMIPQEHKLILNIVDYYEGYFTPLDFIEAFLKPNSLMHFFLTKEIGDQKYPSLFFECPIDRLDILKEIAFPGTVIDVDGFVLKHPSQTLFESWAEQGNNDYMFRDHIRAVYFSFHLWRDFNGLFLVTDKFDIPALKKSLNDSDLNKRIADYIAAFSGSAISDKD